MKKPIVATATALTLLFALSCRKELRDDSGAPATLGIAKGSGFDCIEGVTLVCGIPKYVNAEHFELVYDCLEAAYEGHSDDFEDLYGSLSEDAYEDMVTQTGFVDEQPLIEYESAVGYSSYRAELASLEEAWLAAGADPQTDPYLADVFVDDVLAAMYDKNGAAIIEGVIVYWAPNGDIYEIPNMDCDLYACILTQGPENCNLDSVKIIKANASSPCGPYFVTEDSVEFYNNDGERRVSWFMKFNHTGGFGGQHIYRSQIRAYKKKNGSWKKRRTALSVNIGGQAFNPEESCKETDGETNPQTPRRRKVRKNCMKFWPKYLDYSAQDERLKAGHHFTGNFTTDKLDVQ